MDKYIHGETRNKLATLQNQYWEIQTRTKQFSFQSSELKGINILSMT